MPAALRAVAKGGVVVCGGIHMSDIPSFPYADLWGEQGAALGGQPDEEGRGGIPFPGAADSGSDGSRSLPACGCRQRTWPISAPAGCAARPSLLWECDTKDLMKTHYHPAQRFCGTGSADRQYRSPLRLRPFRCRRAGNTPAGAEEKG